jgi:hypothetical protein
MPRSVIYKLQQIHSAFPPLKHSTPADAGVLHQPQQTQRRGQFFQTPTPTKASFSPCDTDQSRDHVLPPKRHIAADELLTKAARSASSLAPPSRVGGVTQRTPMKKQQQRDNQHRKGRHGDPPGVDVGLPCP